MDRIKIHTKAFLGGAAFLFGFSGAAFLARETGACGCAGMAAGVTDLRPLLGGVFWVRKKGDIHNTEAVSRDSWFSSNSNSAYLGHLSLLFNGNRRRLPRHLLTPRGRGKRSLRGAPSALGRHVNGRPPPIVNFMKRLRSRIPTLTILGVIMYRFCIVHTWS